MTKRSRLWRWAAALFVLINLLGAGYAVAMGEPAHAGTHAVLLLLGYGAYLAWRYTPRSARRELPPAELPPADQRIDYLQQSVDAIALEVERIGEKQRFSEKVRSERGETPPKKDES